jgi:hypothetical protein
LTGVHKDIHQFAAGRDLRRKFKNIHVAHLTFA